MANYYSDHPEIGFYLNNPLMARIVELKEKGFADAKEYDYAPVVTWKVRTSRTVV